MTNNHPPSKLRCLPVEQQGSLFVVDEEWLRCDLPLPDPDELRSILTKDHKQISGRVLIDGKEVSALVFVSKAADHCSYALLNEAENSTEAATSIGPTEQYLDLFHSAYAFSEALLPEQRCYLPAAFVEPTLYNRNQEKLVSILSAKSSRRLIISGSAGAGKTTLLRHLMLQLARSSSEGAQRNIPVYIALRNWRRTDSFELCAKRALTDLKGDWLADNFDYLAHRGDLTFALDGIDEISNDVRDIAMRDLRLFVHQYENCSFLLSIRTGVEAHPFAGFVDLELRPFNRAQVREIIYHKLYAQRPWKPFWSRLASEASLLELVGNPLLLTLLLARYVRKELSPYFVTESISAMMEALVDEWDAVRGIVRSKNAELSPARKASLLKILADHIDLDHRSFSTHEVADKLRRICPNEPPGTVLLLLEQHTSMIKRNEDGNWSFRHRLIQEFYSCLHGVDRLSAKFAQTIGSLAKSSDGKGARVLRFLAGMSSDASGPIASALNLAPPYRPGVAIALCEAFSQRLTIDPNVVDGFALYCRVLLEDMLAQARIVEAHTSDPSRWRLKVIAPEQGRLEWIQSFSELLEAIYKVRDGSAHQALHKALDESSKKPVQALGMLLLADGALEVGQQENDLPGNVVAKIGPLLPELPDGLPHEERTIAVEATKH